MSLKCLDFQYTYDNYEVGNFYTLETNFILQIVKIVIRNVKLCEHQLEILSLIIVAYLLFSFLYSRILVLDQGHVKEFDRPQTLLADKTSVFYGMAKDAGLVK